MLHVKNDQNSPKKITKFFFVLSKKCSQFLYKYFYKLRVLADNLCAE